MPKTDSINGKLTEQLIQTRIALSRRLRRTQSTNKTLAVVVIILVAFIGSSATLLTLAKTSATTSIVLDGSKSGPAFQGIGAISGGGGNSRLLIDYPEPQRRQILDYLFKPNYGASIQLLKLEIGGDSDSTDGSEPSIEHSVGQQPDCNSGYEWWLAEQAKARNPNIKLYGLQWAAPGWTGNSSTHTIWTKANVNYVIRWMDCAKSHNLTVNYLGGWNENGYNALWFENLRAALNTHGYHNVRIVAADEIPLSNWGVAKALTSDPAFNSSVSVIGEHNPCRFPTTGYTCATTSTAENLNKPLWASELGSMDANTGAVDMVRAINNSYIQADITGMLEWPMVDSMPAGLPYENRGLITAGQPWSGNYSVNLMTWAIAQTTQFVRPGWLHINGANKAIGNSGTYNAYEAPDHSNWSIVAENTGSYAGQGVVVPQEIKVAIRGGLRTSTVHVWATNLWTSDSSQWFAPQSNVPVVNGVFSYTIPAGYAITFTTTSGQTRPNTVVPNPTTMALPYTASPDASNEPDYLAAQDGAFEYTSCKGGRSGNCIEQMAPQTPIFWKATSYEPRFPYAIVGDSTWGNYTVSSDVLFAKTGSRAGIIGRFSNQLSGTNPERFDGYELTLNDSGTWGLYSNTSAGSRTALGTGSIGGITTGTWYNLSLEMSGTTLTASINGTDLTTVTDSSHSLGLAGIESNWTNVQYDKLSVSP